MPGMPVQCVWWQQSAGRLDARSRFQRFQGSLRAPAPGLVLLIMVCWRAFGNTALGRPRSVEDLWGVGFPTQAGGVAELIVAKVGKVKRCDAQELSHTMDEEVSDSLPYLKELENKVGRKMPESLLVWVRDAAECEEFGRSGEGGELGSGLGDSFSEKISTLRQEMVNVPSGFYTSGTLFCGNHLSSCIF